MGSMLYKVLPRDEWERAESDGVFQGSGIDHDDGFIHLSAADQVAQTVKLHFAGRTDLVLVAIDEGDLRDRLRWEPSRGGMLFPHVYGTIAMSAVRRADPLPLGENGVHRFPADFPV